MDGPRTIGTENEENKERCLKVRARGNNEKRIQGTWEAR
jgi:hypothetical protein